MSEVEMTELYDNALLGILQHVGNIENFLQIYFGFLFRKTDFYRVLESPNDRMGFPPGVAEKIVLKTFRSFKKLARQEQERAMRLKEASRAPPAVNEVEVSSPPEVKETVQEPGLSEVSSTGQPEPAITEPTAGNEMNEQAADCKQLTTAKATGSKSSTGPSGESNSQANPDSYNGAVRENYSWSQDCTDVEVRVFVQPNIVKGRQVSVNLHSGGVRIAVKEGASERVLMEGEFKHKIHLENSLWSLEPGKCVLLSLNKIGEEWWRAVLKVEQEIDENQIHRERPMASVDEEEHAVLDRLTFDYHQKMQGKPQSHERKVHEMLKKGWDAEGSPFKGQAFDPSLFDIPSSAVQF